MVEASARPQTLGRYRVYGPIAAGGMGTVHYGRLVGAAGFARTVAIKRLHATLARDPEFVEMFLEEARLAGRVRHPNVVSVLDVESSDGEIFLVMDYVHGETLSRVLEVVRQRHEVMPAPVALSIIVDVLRGLHAAHETNDERGQRLGIVHRDVSPQNVLVGVDGVARVVDFGIARAVGRTIVTKDGHLKGKLAYMPPEQIRGLDFDRRVDVWATAVILWEALTGKRLFHADSEAATFGRVLEHPIDSPCTATNGVSAELGEAVLRGIERAPTRRYATAREFEVALEGAHARASPSEVAAYLAEVVSDRLRERARVVADIELDRDVTPEPPSLTQSHEGETRGTSVTAVTAVPALPVSARARAGDTLRAWVVPSAALLAALGVGWWVRAPGPPRAEPTPLATSLPVAPAAVAAPPASASAPEAPSARPPVAVLATASPPAPASAAPSPKASHPPPLSLRGARGSLPVAAAPKSKPGNCYTLDSAGFEHIKPECLQGDH